MDIGRQTERHSFHKVTKMAKQRRTLTMKPGHWMMGAAAAVLLGVSLAPPAAAAEGEQYLAGLVYRTGAYAPNGIPFANGMADYYALLNARDGGINGVKLNYERSEEHTSELQSLVRISYAVFCLKQ